MRNKGFTLMEVMVALGLTGLLFMTVASAYRWAATVQIASLTRVPLAVAYANLSTAVRDSVRSASCLRLPQTGGAGDVLLGYTGQDCSGNAFDAGVPTGYFLVCLSGSRLFFQRGAGAPTSFDPVNCGTGGGSWSVLTPLSVVAERINGAPLFSRPAGLKNAVSASIRVKHPLLTAEARQASESADAASDPARDWSVNLALQQAATP